MSAARFEGSFLGDASRIGDEAVLECKICWYCYDPAQGDEARQIRPGTPFSALPADWRCPQCDGERDQFMVVGAGPAAGEDDRLARLLAEKPAQLVEAFRHIFNTKMRDTPFSNRSLGVEAVGFRAWEGRIVGVLIVPWFMNLVVLPGPDDDWTGIRIGERRLFAFPSGTYEFLHNERPPAGSYYACSLFSGMGEFASQLQATDVARAAIAGLFDPANREDTDRAADISAIREKELSKATADDSAPADAPAAANPTRRAFLTGDLAAREGVS